MGPHLLIREVDLDSFEIAIPVPEGLTAWVKSTRFSRFGVMDMAPRPTSNDFDSKPEMSPFISVRVYWYSTSMSVAMSSQSSTISPPIRPELVSIPKGGELYTATRRVSCARTKHSWRPKNIRSKKRLIINTSKKRGINGVTVRPGLSF